MIKPYTILLADDHTILRAGLKELINKDPLLKVTGETQTGEELLIKLKSRQWDLIVLDLSMPGMGGLQALQEMQQMYPRTKILVLTMQKDHEHFKHAMKCGACGYILKEDAYEQLVLAIKLVLKGKKYVSPSVATILTDRFIRSIEDSNTPSLEILTKREQQILKMVAEGLANKNIAAKLKISPRTVETHRAHLTDKLGVKSTAGLVRYALSKGLLG